MSQVAIVTGAARGIGAATARRLSEQGWAVVAVDRAGDDPRLPYPMGTLDELEAIVGSLRGAVAVVGDAGQEATLADAVRLAEQRFGGVDAVIAAAGVIAGGVPLWEMPEDELDAVLDVNLRGAIAAARVGVPALLRRPSPRSGRYIAVASAAATNGLPMLAAYCAAKAGVCGLVRALAVELTGTGITAAAVSPGSTDTPILAESARLYGLTSGADFADHQPINRLLGASEVAEMICWLAGPGGAVVTGANLIVDGGLTA